MPNIVTLFRYIRPYNKRLFEQTGRVEADSQQGVTFKVELDYNRRMIGVQYAICNQDIGEASFNKKSGADWANNRWQILMPMWEGPSPLLGTDLTEFIVYGLGTIVPYGMPPSDFHRIKKMFKNRVHPSNNHRGDEYIQHELPPR